jgi:hypothetical protein
VVIKTNRSDKTEIKKKFTNQRPPAEPGPFQGPSSYPQLCWWSLIIGHVSVIAHAQSITPPKNGVIQKMLLEMMRAGHNWIVAT